MLLSASRLCRRRSEKGGRRYSTRTRAQFTGEALTGLLEQHDVRISMDGKGSYNDNLFIERLWRTVKYEEVYLKAYEDGREARVGIGDVTVNI